MEDNSQLPGDNWMPIEKRVFTSQNAYEDLKSKYKNPLHPVSFLGIDKIYKFYNGVLSKKKIKKYLNSTEVNTIMRMQPPNRSNQFTPTIAFYYLDLFQVDLVDVSRISESNNGVKFLLCGIDVFTRKLFVQPVKDKKALSVLSALKAIFGFLEHPPSNLSSDAGGEFVNKHVSKMLKNLGVKFYISVSENKCSIVEASQKTLQRKMYSYMVNKESIRYIDVLQQIVESYNRGYHRFLKMSPNDAAKQENFKKLQILNMDRLFKLNQVKPVVIYKIGDQVRATIDKKKNPFVRSYDVQNSIAKYQIYKISTRNSVYAKYYLKHMDSDKKITGGWFHARQLTLCTNDTFRGRVTASRVRRGKKQFKFSYAGYPKEHDQWLDESAITSDLG